MKKLSSQSFNIGRMKYLTLELIKRHLNLNADYTDEDKYLEMLGNAVENAVEKHIDCDLATLAWMQDDGKLPVALIEAMLLLLGVYYSNREAVAFVASSEIPLAFTYLLDLFKNYSGEEEIDEEMLEKIIDKLDELYSYMEFDKTRTIEGEGLEVTTSDSGKTTTINIDTIDCGEY